MAEGRGAAFPLRLRNPRLRALLREVAEREHISQNELIEQALGHELAVRGARVVEDLAAAAKRLSELSEDAYALLIEASIDKFAAGEAEHEPLQAYAFHEAASAGGSGSGMSDPLGVLAAFESGRR